MTWHVVEQGTNADGSIWVRAHRDDGREVRVTVPRRRSTHDAVVEAVEAAFATLRPLPPRSAV